MSNDTKKSFIVYTDLSEVVEELTDTQTGTLFKAMLIYAAENRVIELPKEIKLLFIQIRRQMDRDAKKWEEVTQKRSAAGRIGGLASAEARASKRKQSIANVSNAKQSQANQAVNVTVNDNENVNDTATVTVGDKERFGRFVDEYISLKVEAGEQIRNRKAYSSKLLEGMLPDYEDLVKSFSKKQEGEQFSTGNTPQEWQKGALLITSAEKALSKHDPLKVKAFRKVCL